MDYPESDLSGRRDTPVPGSTSPAGTSPRNKRFIYKKFAVQISSANTVITKSFSLDKDIESVEAVTVTTDNEDNIFDLSQRLEINGQEILPEGFEARLLFAYASVPVNDRYFSLHREPAGNGVIKITATDKSTSGFAAYTVFYTFKCVKADSATR